MEEIVDKYTGLRFRSRQEYDIFKRMPEWSRAVEEYYRRWEAEYECYFCGNKFYTLEELKRHYEEYHIDKLLELSAIAREIRLREVK